jgi:microcystin-dependent protein
MVLLRVTDLIDEIEAVQLNQYAALLEGDTGAGKPVALTALNNATDWTFQVANQDLTNGRAFRALKANLTDPWLQIDGTGVTVEGLVLRHVTTPSAPGANLMAVYPKTDELLYFRSGAAGVETRLAKYTELVTGILTTTGDLPYASAANTVARLGIGTAYQALVTNAGATAPQWGASLQSVLTTQGDLPYASAANSPQRLAIGTARQALLTNAGATAPAWGASLQSLLTATGDIAYASAANTPARLAVGATGSFLGSAAGVPAWGYPVPIGTVTDFAGTVAPTYWLLCYGQAISRATYSGLFTAIGTTHGAGDGVTTFNLPDLRGRTTAGRDDMGGAAASRITAGGSGITGTTVGAVGGAQVHTLATSEMPAHSHTPTLVVSPAGGGGGAWVEGGSNVIAGTVALANTGGGGVHQNTQPTMILNKIIFAGA